MLKIRVLSANVPQLGMNLQIQRKNPCFLGRKSLKKKGNKIRICLYTGKFLGGQKLNFLPTFDEGDFSPHPRGNCRKGLFSCKRRLLTHFSNLWSFVAKFTEFGPEKLYKLYRTACRKRDALKDEQKREIQKMKENYSSTLHDIGKMNPADRLEMEEARKRALGK